MSVDLFFVIVSMLINIYIFVLYLQLSDKFIEGCSKYYLTFAWMFRKDILTEEGRKIRIRLLMQMLLFTAVSVSYFWL